MSTEAVIGVLLAVIGSLISTIGVWIVYELRVLRRRTHRHSSAVTALNMIMYTVCKKLGIVWKSNPEDEE